MILSNEEYTQLDKWMEDARKLGRDIPVLESYMINATFPLFMEFYKDRGIDPSGREF